MPKPITLKQHMRRIALLRWSRLSDEERQKAVKPANKARSRKSS
jgi:hypothetical protein